MPELPEVETVMRGIAPALRGQTIRKAAVYAPKLRWPVPETLASTLTGAEVLGLRRRAKYILIDLKGRPSVLVHLGMSGRMSVFEAGAEPPPRAKHDHIELVTSAGVVLRYNDARRFGAWLLVDSDDHPLLANLGPEPLGNAFHSEVLTAALKGRAVPIKAALLDQTVVAGLGNIYVAEALFRAGLHPTRASGKISARHLEALTQAIKDVLRDAIASGGSSLRDHMQVNGDLGYFQHSFDVYGRTGAPCHRAGCGGRVARIVQSGRSTFYCPACQH